MTRPSNIDELAPDIREYIQYLEQKIDDTEEDGLKGFLIVINRKMNEIKRSIDDYEFKIQNSDDRAFERFWSATTHFKKLADDMKSLRLEFGLTEEQVNGKKVSPQEAFAQRRKQEKDDSCTK